MTELIMLILIVCRRAKTLVYLASLPYTGVSQLCVVLPRPFVGVAAFYFRGRNITSSLAYVSESKAKFKAKATLV